MDESWLYAIAIVVWYVLGPIFRGHSFLLLCVPAPALHIIVTLCNSTTSLSELDSFASHLASQFASRLYRPLLDPFSHIGLCLLLLKWADPTVRSEACNKKMNRLIVLFLTFPVITAVRFSCMIWAFIQRESGHTHDPQAVLLNLIFWLMVSLIFAEVWSFLVTVAPEVSQAATAPTPAQTSTPAPVQAPASTATAPPAPTVASTTTAASTSTTVPTSSVTTPPAAQQRIPQSATARSPVQTAVPAPAAAAPERPAASRPKHQAYCESVSDECDDPAGPERNTHHEDQGTCSRRAAIVQLIRRVVAQGGNSRAQIIAFCERKGVDPKEVFEPAASAPAQAVEARQTASSGPEGHMSGQPGTEEITIASAKAPASPEIRKAKLEALIEPLPATSCAPLSAAERNPVQTVSPPTARPASFDELYDTTPPRTPPPPTTDRNEVAVAGAGQFDQPQGPLTPPSSDEEDADKSFPGPPLQPASREHDAVSTMTILQQRTGSQQNPTPPDSDHGSENELNAQICRTTTQAARPALKKPMPAQEWLAPISPLCPQELAQGDPIIWQNRNEVIRRAEELLTAVGDAANGRPIAMDLYEPVVQRVEEFGDVSPSTPSARPSGSEPDIGTTQAHATKGLPKSSTRKEVGGNHQEKCDRDEEDAQHAQAPVDRLTKLELDLEFCVQRLRISREEQPADQSYCKEVYETFHQAVYTGVRAELKHKVLREAKLGQAFEERRWQAFRDCYMLLRAIELAAEGRLHESDGFLENVLLSYPQKQSSADQEVPDRIPSEGQSNAEAAPNGIGVNEQSIAQSTANQPNPPDERHAEQVRSSRPSTASRRPFPSVNRSGTAPQNLHATPRHTDASAYLCPN
ncbi:uncharacterized protein LTR77_010294 [Saxophila tyrrhenica]|uniref:Uncharacterized protein n=1 Tax=Saxophila tyrrhenica TaxID=1690608 RepID=A0AAV9NVM4_9PEZI|nr:hypothetical protein LTR77_010294 [Saxophila tyrrhenica]